MQSAFTVTIADSLVFLLRGLSSRWYQIAFECVTVYTAASYIRIYAASDVSTTKRMYVATDMHATRA